MSKLRIRLWPSPLHFSRPYGHCLSAHEPQNSTPFSHENHNPNVGSALQASPLERRKRPSPIFREFDVRLAVLDVLHSIPTTPSVMYMYLFHKAFFTFNLYSYFGLWDACFHQQLCHAIICYSCDNVQRHIGQVACIH